MARSKGVVVQISAEDNTARAFESVQAQVQALRQQVSDLRSRLSGGGPGEDLARGMEHSVPQVVAASSAIRAFEGNLPIRAVERFLATTLRLGPVLQAAFGFVGFGVTAGLVAKEGMELYDLEQKGKHAGEEISKAFGEMNEKLRTSNDELALSNAKLEDEIGKISGHPTNGLASALAEARVEADKLQDSLASDVKQLDALLKEHEVGTLEALISGTHSNKGTNKEISDVAEQVEREGQAESAAYVKAMEAAGSDQKKQEEATRQHYARMAEIPAEAARKMRARATEIAAQQKEYDQRMADAASQGVYTGANDLTPQRSAFEGAAETFDRMQNAAQLSGVNVADTHAKDAAEAKRNSDEALRRKQEAERKLQDAEEKQAAAERSMQDAEAKAAAATQKAADDEAMSALESKHKAMLVSDEDFNKQRLSLQQANVAAQRQSIASQRGDIDDQLDSLTNQPMPQDKTGQAEYYSKILELTTKKTELDAKDAELTAQQAKNVQQAADYELERGKRLQENADKIAANLEAITGGSVSARQKQSSDQYQLKRQQAVAMGADDATLSEMDRQQGIDQASIGVRGAEQTYGAANVPIAAARSAVGDDEARGRVSAMAAQQEKIALDEQEAANIKNNLLPAVEQLAAAGDASAAAKVVELQQEIKKLEDPVNEVAATVRNQLDSAFETLFENLGKGQKAWKQFVKTIESDTLKDTFKQFIEPGLQTGLGMLIPNGGKGESGGIPGAVGATAASAKGGWLQEAVPGILGIGGAAMKGSAGGVQIQIVNQSSQPVQGTATSQNGGDLTDSLRGPVVQILLEDLERGGPIGQALAGGGLLA